ncbi:electron transport complex subunit RsxA [Sessilibacter corallicola]|uniref:electron transport complex subunit RsxA n=1 Tax=Sessilibacter corallicola TaxID=2904075 RepID=UPI001E5F5AAA|nr:electron transport complex subunit RsxA [Sessilibacter corallicola]MCE2029669.1 electron transport complex subunit RsxA [Sessilibacter corallicola]
MDYISLLIGTVLVNNVVLVRFLGLCPFMGVSGKLSTSVGMSAATTFVMTLASGCSWLLEFLVLQPLNIGFLRILGYILVIAAVVQFTETVLKKTSPALYRSLGIYLPLITTNCAVLGVPLISVREQQSFSEALTFGFGSALGFCLIMVIFAGIRERLQLASVPRAFEGPPVALVTAGLLAMTFLGFGGLVQAV